MNNTGSHERFSELIGPYLRRELAPDDARELEEHLASCPDCRAEAEGARALTAAPAEGLTEAERGSLHAAVTAAIERPDAPARVVPLRPRWAGAAKFVTAAAAIAVIAVAGIWATTSGNLGGSDDSGADGGDSPAALEGGGADGGGSVGVPRPLFLDDDSGRLLYGPEEQAGDEDEVETSEDHASGNQFALTPLEQGALANYAEEGPLFKAFADAYLAPVPERDARRALLGLAKQAPLPEFEDQVNECGGGFLSRNPGSAISVAAVLGNFEGQGALVIGFVTTEAPSGELNRYTYEVWRINDCTSPITTFGGALVR
ncbi:MAG: hypothetical protein GEU71_06100 [Actinobacteria bacterium]|nr:hypothetical protein [Actinomycetota bacterium]